MCPTLSVVFVHLHVHFFGVRFVFAPYLFFFYEVLESFSSVLFLTKTVFVSDHRSCVLPGLQTCVTYTRQHVSEAPRSGDPHFT